MEAVTGAPDDVTLPDGSTPPASGQPSLGSQNPEVGAASIEPVATPATTAETAESREFDFGPFRQKAMQLYEAQSMIESGQKTQDMKEGETPRAASDRIHNELIRLSAQALIDSKGEVVIPMRAADESLKKGVFAELARVEKDALARRLSVREESKSFSFAHAVAAETVKIFLAQRAQPTEGESGEPLDDGTTGAVREDIGKKVDVVEAKTGV